MEKMWKVWRSNWTGGALALVALLLLALIFWRHDSTPQQRSFAFDVMIESGTAPTAHPCATTPARDCVTLRQYQ